MQLTRLLIIQCLSLANCIFLCAQTSGAETLTTGKLLISAEGMGDSNFSETVVLITAYGPKGTMGLILNHPSDLPMPKAWSGKKAAGALSYGGPVETFRVVALHQTQTPLNESLKVLPDLYFLNSKELIEKAIALSPDRVRLFAGYAGWAPGQLEFEFKLDAWHVLPGSAGIAFDASPQTLWNRLIRKTKTLTVRALSPEASEKQLW